MADDKQEDNSPLEFDAMPGADRAEPEPETRVDLNFGLGEEPAENESEAAEGEVADLSEEAVEPEETEHNIAEADEETEYPTKKNSLVKNRNFLGKQFMKLFDHILKIDYLD